MAARTTKCGRTDSVLLGTHSTLEELTLFSGGLGIAESVLHRLAARARLSLAIVAPLTKLPDVCCCALLVSLD